MFMEAIEMIAAKLYPRPRNNANGLAPAKDFPLCEGLRNTMDIINKHFENS
jgi:hypothetical protein